VFSCHVTDDEFGEKSVCVLLDGEESELTFVDHPSSEMSVSISLFEAWEFSVTGISTIHRTLSLGGQDRNGVIFVTYFRVLPMFTPSHSLPSDDKMLTYTDDLTYVTVNTKAGCDKSVLLCRVR